METSLLKSGALYNTTSLAVILCASYAGGTESELI